MSADAKEAAFQQDILNELVAGGWQLGSPAGYNRGRALPRGLSGLCPAHAAPKLGQVYQALPQRPDDSLSRSAYIPNSMATKSLIFLAFYNG